MKRVFIAIIKIGISCAILTYLFQQAWRDDSFLALYEQPKRWSLLALACAAAIASLLLTIVRWRILVQALGIPFALRDALRLGMLGYLFNFFTLGIVGGDVLKAVMIARRQHGQRLEAVSSVLVDRVIGLFALFLVASAAILSLDWGGLQVRDESQLAAVRRVCSMTIGLAAIGGISSALVMTPAVTRLYFVQFFTHLPRIGVWIGRIIAAVQLYQQRKGALTVGMMLSFCVHLLSTASVFLVAQGLPGNAPSFAAHFVIVPIAMVAGAIPLPGGLGAVEYALDFLYRGISSVEIAERQGFIIALAFRVITMIIASIGFVYYLVDRRELRNAIKEAEDETESREDGDLTLSGEAAPPVGTDPAQI